MRVLAFDTATRATTVALADPALGLELAARDDPRAGDRPGHTTRLMALIAEVMDRAGWGWDSVERIAVGTGPGTFTGLRIGVATARALARARETQLVGVSTLRSLALAAAPEAQACDVVVCALDARRREVFAAAWDTAAAVTEQAIPARLDPVAMAPSELAQKAVGLGDRRLIVGDGAVAFRAVLEGSGTVIPGDTSNLHRVDATYHCRLAQQVPPAAAGDVLPEYLRVPDAELALEAARAR